MCGNLCRKNSLWWLNAGAVGARHTDPIFGGNNHTSSFSSTCPPFLPHEDTSLMRKDHPVLLSNPQHNFKCEIFILQESLGLSHPICCRRPSSECWGLDPGQWLMSKRWTTTSVLLWATVRGLTCFRVAESSRLWTRTPRSVFSSSWLCHSCMKIPSSFFPSLMPKLVTSTPFLTFLITCTLQRLQELRGGRKAISGSRLQLTSLLTHY